MEGRYYLVFSHSNQAEAGPHGVTVGEVGGERETETTMVVSVVSEKALDLESTLVMKRWVQYAQKVDWSAFLGRKSAVADPVSVL